MRPALVAIALMLAPLAAAAQGDGGTVPADCSDLDEEGRCAGDVATWCGRTDPGVDAGVATFECAAVGARCEVTPGLGAWCGVPAGASCALPSAGGRRQLACVDDEGLLAGGGCELSTGCGAGFAPCAPGASGCDGDAALLACAPFGQPLVVDCGLLGGRCVEGGCVDVEEGASCGEGLACAGDLVCAGGEAGVGRCAPAGVEAKQSPAPEEPAAEPAPSCAAAGPATAGRLPGALGALLALGLLRRRVPVKRRMGGEQSCSSAP